MVDFGKVLSCMCRCVGVVCVTCFCGGYFFIIEVGGKTLETNVLAPMPAVLIGGYYMACFYAISAVFEPPIISVYAERVA